MDRLQNGWSWRRLKSWPWVGIAISSVCLALIVLKNVFPNIFKMDAISIGLLIIGVAPWFRSVIKSIDLPGIAKIELHDVEKLAKKVEASELPSPETSTYATPQDASDAGQTPEEVPAGVSGHDVTEPGGSLGDESTGGGNVPPVPAPTPLPESVSTSIFQIVPRAIVKPAAALAELESKTAVLGSEMRTSVQLNAMREILLRGLRNLCQLNDISHFALSPADMLAGLVKRMVITENQADGIAAAINMVNEVTLAPATPEASQRTLDVAKEVSLSLDLMIRQAEIIRMARNRRSHYQADK